MRICHIVRQFHPSVGGLESFVADLATAQIALGHDCEVLTLNRIFRSYRDKLSDKKRVLGLKVTRVPAIGGPRLFYPLIASHMLEDYDILHVHGVDGMFDRIARHPRRKGQAVIATSHGLFFHTPWMRTMKHIYLNTLTRLNAGRYDLVIANSQADEKRLSGVCPRLVRLANGVTPLATEMSTGRDLLYIGRLASHKRVDRLLMALMLPALDGSHLHVVGPEWDVSVGYLSREAARMGVLDRVTFHGRLHQEQLEELARSCGVFVSASRYEGFGMSMIEAMSAGLVPVVQANESFRELMSSSPVGALADFGDPPAAAQAIRAELDGLSIEARRAAIAFANRFSWRTHAERTLGYYQQALAHADRRWHAPFWRTRSA